LKNFENKRDFSSLADLGNVLEFLSQRPSLVKSNPQLNSLDLSSLISFCNSQANQHLTFVTGQTPVETSGSLNNAYQIGSGKMFYQRGKGFQRSPINKANEVMNVLLLLPFMRWLYMGKQYTDYAQTYLTRKEYLVENILKFKQLNETEFAKKHLNIKID
jgi:hypothetical protein